MRIVMPSSQTQQRHAVNQVWLAVSSVGIDSAHLPVLSTGDAAVGNSAHHLAGLSQGLGFRGGGADRIKSC